MAIRRQDERESHSGICWPAIYSRDPRFDGRFFVGAKNTGLYCRNVCPVPFARPTNIVMFACASAAESAGYRPCKRCRPQAIPGTAAWMGTSAVVSRALRLIFEGALNERSVEQLAARLGLGSRQLRRLFVQHLGVSPVHIATAHRVQLARELIEESGYPMTEIAFRSGFKSIREYNHAIRSATGHSPSQLRRSAGAVRIPARNGGLELRLPYKQPFDWKSLIAFLRPRAIPGVEAVRDNSYQRTIEVAGATGYFDATPDEAASRLVVRLVISNYKVLSQAVERIRRIFDLGADPTQIGSHLSRDPKLQRLVELRPGLRVPGVWDSFEGAVLAVLGQTLSARGSIRAVRNLARIFGKPIDTKVRGMDRLFPQPDVLAAADLSRAGVDGAAARSLRKLARGHASAQCGISESTANYIAMRASGEPDAFPSEDLALRRILAVSGPPVSPAKAIALAEKWRPWRAYAAMHIVGSADQILTP